MTVREVVESIVGHLDGAIATDGEIEWLLSSLPPDLVPGWLVSLLKEYRLAGAHFSLNENDDCSGLGAEVIWLTPKQMVSEACEAEPGMSVLSSRFLPIGVCAVGSGDPYFLDLSEEIDDPPVVRIPHDFGGRSSYPLEKIEPVTRNLSEFFRSMCSKEK